LESNCFLKMENDFTNKIINGDSLKELKKIPNETFDLIFADPPYNLQLKNKLTRPDRSKVNRIDLKLVLLMINGINLKVLKNMTSSLLRG